ncbi:hypothetical protein CGI59_10880 [Vibrio parahaemolyticus]|nr:hypothetical protein [Vibrio parahaemolyticus]EGQ9294458.1 hypothetical protein [Vibrio parahaemolyticus]TOB70277.1 hypothetical protein CGK03_03850 [Vibrio parahaemolyticus]TOI53677.1 hypothetical protein CGI59_10880 [Vibrio parahaemolyticus]TOO16580.1 hypothetical protein CGH44_02965 [Vibrio parahaemolyticus]
MLFEAHSIYEPSSKNSPRFGEFFYLHAKLFYFFTITSRFITQNALLFTKLI